MIAHDIIVNFCIFSLLKYDRFFGKHFGHDNSEVKQSLDPALCGGSFPGLISKICLSFLFYDTLK